MGERDLRLSLSPPWVPVTRKEDHGFPTDDLGRDEGCRVPRPGSRKGRQDSKGHLKKEKEFLQLQVKTTTVEILRGTMRVYHLFGTFDD